MRTQYTTRQGLKVPVFMSRAAAVKRLAYLDAQEAETVRSAPTDSGDVRTNYQSEAAAIRAALK